MNKDQIEDAIKATVGSSKITVKQDTWAYTQIRTLVKYHNMKTQRLAQKVNLPEAAVKRFKKWYSTKRGK